MKISKIRTEENIRRIELFGNKLVLLKKGMQIATGDLVFQDLRNGKEKIILKEDENIKIPEIKCLNKEELLVYTPEGTIHIDDNEKQEYHENIELCLKDVSNENQYLVNFFKRHPTEIKFCYYQIKHKEVLIEIGEYSTLYEQSYSLWFYVVFEKMFKKYRVKAISKKSGNLVWEYETPMPTVTERRRTEVYGFYGVFNNYLILKLSQPIIVLLESSTGMIFKEWDLSKKALENNFEIKVSCQVFDEEKGIIRGLNNERYWELDLVSGEMLSVDISKELEKHYIKVTKAIFTKEYVIINSEKNLSEEYYIQTAILNLRSKKIEWIHRYQDIQYQGYFVRDPMIWQRQIFILTNEYKLHVFDGFGID